VVLAARRASNLSGGFHVVSDPQVADASRRMGRRIIAVSLLAGLAYASVIAAIPL
jgi:hypothetical protein